MARARKQVSQAYEISPRVEGQAATQPYRRQPGDPLTRPLRIYTLDPSVPARIGGVATVQVPYEDLEPGPVGALFQVEPGDKPPLEAEALDLDDPHRLLEDGFAPSPGNGQFHLQMVYAVCSLTYAAFRRALGRDISWFCGVEDGKGRRRLRVMPFAFKEDNAYYDRGDNGLSFGYFNARKRPAGFTVPGGLVFSGLSHDIIAHETAHALLDGLRAEFYDPAQPDVLGFHEGFADLVAYFLHFTYPEVVEEAMRVGAGSVSHATLLTGLASEFGYAGESPSKMIPMRSAIDVEGISAFDSDLPPSGRGGPVRYKKDMESHDLGSILVSAVFEAFVTVFQRKTGRLLRVAGLTPEDVSRRVLEGHLARVLAEQASSIASEFLNVCIRAIDYCPPVDMEISEYLRALITADAEIVPDDKWGYREALMRSFRRRHLFPNHVGFMTEDAVRWDRPERSVKIPELAFSRLRFEGDPARAASPRELRRQADALGRFVSAPGNASHFALVAPGGPLPKGIEYVAPIRIESIRCARCVSPDGSVRFDLIAEVIQRGTVRRDGTLFDFIGGSTIVLDPYGEVRYTIYKRLDNPERQDRQLKAMRGPMKRFWVRKGGKMVAVQQAHSLKMLHRARRGAPRS